MANGSVLSCVDTQVGTLPTAAAHATRPRVATHPQCACGEEVGRKRFVRRFTGVLKCY